jgi:hypothetical protein
VRTCVRVHWYATIKQSGNECVFYSVQDHEALLILIHFELITDHQTNDFFNLVEGSSGSCPNIRVRAGVGERRGGAESQRRAA